MVYAAQVVPGAILGSWPQQGPLFWTDKYT